LLIGSHCPHCQSVLDSLTRLVKEGRLARLTVINLNASPGAPEARGVRSVPWTRLGPFELTGALSAAELRDWSEMAASGGGWGRYIAYLIEGGRLDALIERIRSAPSTLTDLLQLFADPDTGLAVRIGVSAAIETLAGSDILRRAAPEIQPLTSSDNPQIRADACYFLGLAGDPVALASLRRLLEDERPEVREVAAEALELLGAPDQDAGGDPHP
jgi:thiol-disulfide isomerase/thioredoxin